MESALLHRTLREDQRCHLSWNILYKCLKCPDLNLKWSPVWLDPCVEVIQFIGFLQIILSDMVLCVYFHIGWCLLCKSRSV